MIEAEIVTLEQQQAELEAQLAEAAETEIVSLEAAANKEINDEVVAELNSLLGIAEEEPLE
ncbi:hypothetical protein [Marinobacterium aestuariivivens]|uniref:Uncharacterized protein n=1 Tax=Marinobacterium aestuariivivens TaxID=1698799 RepID=A0ABW2A1U0_9GAMM